MGNASKEVPTNPQNFGIGHVKNVIQNPCITYRNYLE
jgi:hypothetical protein